MDEPLDMPDPHGAFAASAPRAAPLAPSAEPPTSGGVVARLVPGGLSIGVLLPRVVSSAVAGPGGITAAPDVDTLGEGDVVLRVRDGETLADGETVRCYSNFGVAVPEGTRLEVAWDGAAFKLIGADCPK